VAVAELIVGALAVVVGTVAAFYAARAARTSREGSEAATERWHSEIQPALTLERNQRTGGAALVGIAGGAARDAYLIQAARGVALGGSFKIGAHATSVALPQLEQIAEVQSAYSYSGTLLFVAADLEGNWWDMLTGEKCTVPDPPPAGPERHRWAGDIASRRLLEIEADRRDK
jgi:hypothetical protein